MAHHHHGGGGGLTAPPYIDPKNLHILVIDSKGSSRSQVCTMLRECLYKASSGGLFAILSHKKTHQVNEEEKRGEGRGAPGSGLSTDCRRRSRRNCSVGAAAGRGGPVRGVHGALRIFVQRCDILV